MSEHMSGLYVDGELQTNIIVPTEITEIMPATLYMYEKLESITIHDGITSIGKRAFCNCNSLTSVTIGNSVTSIGDEAFYNCRSLTSVTIGKGLTTVKEKAFYNCSNLNSVYISDLAAWCNIDFEKTNSNPLCQGGKLFINGVEATEVVIPDGVTSIKKYTFYGCKGLTSIAIGNSVTSIGSCAFYNCTSLASVTIPNSITSIGESAFNNCYNIKSVYISDLSAWCKIDFASQANPLYNKAKLYLNNTEAYELVIPSDITEIKKYAFYGCDNLTSVTIPESVTKIGDYAIYSCSMLESVHFNGTTPPTLSSNTFSINYSDSTKNPKIYVPSGAEAAYLSSTWNITHKRWIVFDTTKDPNMPSNSNYTIKYTTSDDKMLTNLDFGDNMLHHIYVDGTGILIFGNMVTSIGERAFYGCGNLTSVTIPESVTKIGERAFGGCTSLTSVTIPDSVTSIGGYAFNCCKGELTVYCNIPDIFLNENHEYEGAFYGSKFTQVTIGDSVTSIGKQAFYNCTSLESVTIGNSVTSIGVAAFGGCTSLTSVTIGNSVTSIGGSAFHSCSSLTSITIPNRVTSIKGYTFEYCSNLTSVTIGKSVTSIEDNAFSYCSSLTSVYCKPTTPPTGTSYMFWNPNPIHIKVYVPRNSVEAYKAASGWKKYASDIEGYDF